MIRVRSPLHRKEEICIDRVCVREFDLRFVRPVCFVFDWHVPRPIYLLFPRIFLDFPRFPPISTDFSPICQLKANTPRRMELRMRMLAMRRRRIHSFIEVDLWSSWICSGAGCWPVVVQRSGGRAIRWSRVCAEIEWVVRVSHDRSTDADGSSVGRWEVAHFKKKQNKYTWVLL